MKRTDGRKLHWTQRPENKARLKSMRRKSAAKRNGHAPEPAATKKPNMLVELAIKGAQTELQELERRIITLRMFLKEKV